MAELWQRGAADLARLIRLGKLSSREATENAIARMRAVNPAINAVNRMLEAEALVAADAADAAVKRGEALGPLHGVPVTTKANVDQVGCPTDNGVPAFRDAIAKEDSPVVANMKRAGAVIIGRTNTPAFSMRLISDNDLHGRTLNPLDPAITPGGSSGGAGAAIACGIGALAHGNDIGGSIRIPAYCCGVVGLRPTVGRVPAFNPSAAGVPRPMASQIMSVQGPLARSVRDLRLGLAAMAAGAGWRDPRWVGLPLEGPPVPRPIRVALLPEVPGGHTDPAQAEAVRTAGRHLEAVGYAVEEAVPPAFEAVVSVWHRIVLTELDHMLGPKIAELGGEGARDSWGHWRALFPPTDLAGLIAAYAERDLLLRQWLSFLEQYPLLVLPTLAHLPPAQDLDRTREGQIKVLDSIRASLPAPALGLPGLSVPVGSAGRLRPGVQIMAGLFREDLCFDAAEAIEAQEGGPVVPIDPRAG
jgi:amidase